YSTCHWCHVMERESFEDPAVATLMNEHYINIKVDREERPDVDAIYMEACQILTGGGGWPLNCFLTPEGKPFYAGTYFPPRPAHNRPSWTDVLTYLADIWANKRETALDQAERLTGYIRKDAPPVIAPPDSAPEMASMPAVFERIKNQFDFASGGFGGAPKFPSSMAIRFLMEYAWYYKHAEALQHAFFSLEKMISGGIYDQLGGGFARYATDREWMVPHFEKMLYDNALLICALSDAYKMAAANSADDRFAILFEDAITETLDFVAREMTNPEGGFYAAQDADSEGVEGKFYVWDQSEIEAALGEKAETFNAFYGVEPGGNWEYANILFRNPDTQTLAQSHLLHRNFKPQRDALLAIRSKRIWPLLDTKILLDWNALMCSAYAQAYGALGKEAYKDAAIRNIDYILTHLRRPVNTPQSVLPLKHALNQDEAFLDDYAFFIAALLDVYEITFDIAYLKWAISYTELVEQAFFDPDQHSFYFTQTGQQDIIVRKKDFYDNATPSGNSVMAHNFQRLGMLYDRHDWRLRAEKMLETMQASITQFPLSFSNWALALLHQVHPAVEIAVVGDDALEKARAIQKTFLPNKIMAASTDSSSELPLLDGKVGNRQSWIYLCHNFSCQKPVVSLEEFFDMIEAGSV
ncbi:MAG: thioredoxin domain-containing protein, partial [Saprospiraceae bacterium]|nr:thioredoxin domain-containing protein [Saprospiraceae bacterium]